MHKQRFLRIWPRMQDYLISGILSPSEKLMENVIVSEIGWDGMDLAEPCRLSAQRRTV